MRKLQKFSFIFIAFVLPLISYLGNSSIAAKGRFIDNGDGTVTDTKLQLMWQKGDSREEMTFERAQAYCRHLDLGKHNDWRLPRLDEVDTATVIELMMPMHSTLPYVRFDLYWSSDPTVLLPFNYHPARGTEVLRAYPAGKNDRAYVRAVRSMRKG